MQLMYPSSRKRVSQRSFLNLYGQAETFGASHLGLTRVRLQ